MTETIFSRIGFVSLMLRIWIEPWLQSVTGYSCLLEKLTFMKFRNCSGQIDLILHNLPKNSIFSCLKACLNLFLILYLCFTMGIIQGEKLYILEIQLVLFLNFVFKLFYDLRAIVVLLRNFWVFGFSGLSSVSTY